MTRLLVTTILLLTMSLALAACVGCASGTPTAVQTPDAGTTDLTYPIVDTNQTISYNATSATSAPQAGASFYGQDAQYAGLTPSYKDNGDGTVSDLNTGLMWQQDPGEKVTWAQAMANIESFSLAGYTDWRVPTVKDLYSLIDFSGSGGTTVDSSTPFIDTNHFAFVYGDETVERFIDSQWVTDTVYVDTTMNGEHTMFGVNFADGRIKGYGTMNLRGGGEKGFFCIYVRGNLDYGVNAFVDNGDSTITDTATGLQWTQDDSGAFPVGDAGDGKLNWEQALAWAEDLTLAGHSDWRLPNAKELQSILDYTRSPATHGTAAIDPVFNATKLTGQNGWFDFGYYWSSTTHLDGPSPGGNGAYVAFGTAYGYMGEWMDVHGAGAQRSDPKTGDPSAYPTGHGPQGDEIRIYNLARAVRDAG